MFSVHVISHFSKGYISGTPLGQDDGFDAQTFAMTRSFALLDDLFRGHLCGSDLFTRGVLGHQIMGGGTGRRDRWHAFRPAGICIWEETRRWVKRFPDFQKLSE